MTKKHFIALAAVIANLPESTTRMEVAVRLGEALMKTNPRFDMARFLAACGGGEVIMKTNPRFDMAQFLAACGKTRVGAN